MLSTGEGAPKVSVSVNFSLRVTQRCHHSHLMNCETFQLCISISRMRLFPHKVFHLGAFCSLRGFFKIPKLNSGQVLHYLITSSSVYLCLNSQEEFFCVLIPGVQPANPSDHKRGKGAKRTMINEPSSPLPRMHLQERHHCGAVGPLQQCGCSESKFYTQKSDLFTANLWAKSILPSQSYT